MLISFDHSLIQWFLEHGPCKVKTMFITTVRSCYWKSICIAALATSQTSHCFHKTVFSPFLLVRTTDRQTMALQASLGRYLPPDEGSELVTTRTTSIVSQ